MFNKKFILLFCLLCQPFTSMADENIERFNIKSVTNCKNKFKDGVDYSTCLDSVLSAKKRELKTWQKNMTLKLTELSSYGVRSDALVLLKKSNQAFEKFKKDNCKWQYLSLLPDITKAGNMSKACHIYMNSLRINELKQLSEFDFL